MLAALGIFIASRCASSEYRRNKINKLTTLLLCPTVFGVLGWSSCAVGAYAGVQLNFATVGASTLSTLSLVLVAAYLGLFAWYAVARVCWADSFS